MKTRIEVTKEGSKQLTLYRVRNGHKNLGEALENMSSDVAMFCYIIDKFEDVKSYLVEHDLKHEDRCQKI